MKEKGIYLYGAGGHAKVIMDIVEASGHRVAGIIDDNPEQTAFMGHPVMHEWTGHGEVIVSIGLNAVRRKVAEQIALQAGTVFGKAIHPTAILSPSAVIGEGTVVMQGSILQSCVQTGRHCIVNTGASIDHDCILGDFVHVSPHATLCGNVTVGEETWIGAGAVVIPGIRIGKGCLIGAGAVVCKDIPDHVVAYGNPCRIIRKLK